MDFPGGPVLGNLLANAGDTGSIPSLGRFHMKSESESCSVISNSLQPHGLYSPWNSSGQNTGVGSFSLLQGIFPTQGLNPGLLHCRQILPAREPRSPTLQADSLPLNHLGSPFSNWYTSYFLLLPYCFDQDLDYYVE